MAFKFITSNTANKNIDNNNNNNILTLSLDAFLASFDLPETISPWCHSDPKNRDRLAAPKKQCDRDNMRLASHSSTHTQHCHPLVYPSFTNPFSLSHICAANPFSIYNSTNLLVLFNDDYPVIELYPSGGLSPTTQFYTLHVKWLTLHSMAINSPISSPYKQKAHPSVKFDQEPVISKAASNNIPQVFERHGQKIVLIFFFITNQLGLLMRWWI